MVALGLLLGLPATPLAVVKASDSPSHFLVTHSGSQYVAASSTKSYSGALKTVVESAVADLNVAGGGTVTFEAGVFNLGSTFFHLVEISNLVIEGQGIDATVIQNYSTAVADTEPFNTKGTYNVVIRDMTVSAGGTARTTSDALDFDKGNFDLVERVKVIASRGKGIIFDGKNRDSNGDNWTSTGNIVRDCDISGTNNDGVQFLASTNNRVEGCYIHDVVGDGIEARASSPTDQQPNKKANDNTIINNVIDNVGQTGIRITSSDRNIITGNQITNSSDDLASEDGIGVRSVESINCADNRVESNVATDNQATKTQRYGLNIASSLCQRTVVANNAFTGNKTGEIRDLGTGTIYGYPDGQAPTAPSGLVATAVSSGQIDLTWTGSTDNVGVSAYEIYRDGGMLAMTAGTTFSDTGLAAGGSYTYVVKARDAAGNVSGPSNTASATTITASFVFSDGFESGNLSAWTTNGGLVAQTNLAHSGGWAAQGTTTDGRTYAKKQLATTYTEGYLRSYVYLAAGYTSQVGVLRYRTATDVSLGYLFVTTTGRLALRNDIGAITTTSSTTLSSGSWHSLELRLVVNGTSSSTEVWLDGVSIGDLSLSNQNWGTTPIGKIQIGEVQSGRTYSVAFDDVAFDTQPVGP
jgi:parallel beta-helix repeat protein